MKRRPVPEVRASSFCVTPRLFRVSWTSSPMSCGLYFKASRRLSYRTGIFYLFLAEIQQNVPVRESIARFSLLSLHMFPLGNKDGLRLNHGPSEVMLRS
jgi:hypothetical protein